MVSPDETVKVYMKEIGHIPLLTPEDEQRLAKEIAEGSEEARQTLVRSNLRLVVKIAHDFKGLGLPLLDLISEGNIGLLQAVERFDPAKGAKFSSYAAWWIKQAMRRALGNQSKTIRIPIHSAGKLNKIKSIRVKLQDELQREPTDGEIAECLDFSKRTVSWLKKADLKGVSLQAALREEGEGKIGDLVADESVMSPEEIVDHHDALEWLTHLVEELDEREKKIIKMRFGLGKYSPKTLEEVSQYMGKTRERIRQIQMEALRRLKALYEEKQ